MDESNRPADPAPAPTSASQQMPAVRPARSRSQEMLAIRDEPLENVIRDMSTRTLAISERLTELKAIVEALAKAFDAHSTRTQERLRALENDEHPEPNGADAE